MVKAYGAEVTLATAKVRAAGSNKENKSNDIEKGNPTHAYTITQETMSGINIETGNTMKCQV